VTLFAAVTQTVQKLRKKNGLRMNNAKTKATSINELRWVCLVHVLVLRKPMLLIQNVVSTVTMTPITTCSVSKTTTHLILALISSVLTPHLQPMTKYKPSSMTHSRLASLTTLFKQRALLKATFNSTRQVKKWKVILRGLQSQSNTPEVSLSPKLTHLEIATTTSQLTSSKTTSLNA
jgi:hypothetical protein